MGLASVELIMAIEDEFGVEFPETNAEKFAIVGNLHDFILLSLKRRGETPDEEEVWERVRAIVVEQLGVRLEEVTHAAHIVDDLHAS